MKASWSPYKDHAKKKNDTFYIILLGRDFLLQLFSCSALGIDLSFFEMLMALEEVSSFRCYINSVTQNRLTKDHAVVGFEPIFSFMLLGKAFFGE